MYQVQQLLHALRSMRVLEKFVKRNPSSVNGGSNEAMENINLTLVEIQALLVAPVQDPAKIKRIVDIAKTVDEMTRANHRPYLGATISLQFSSSQTLDEKLNKEFDDGILLSIIHLVNAPEYHIETANWGFSIPRNKRLKIASTGKTFLIRPKSDMAVALWKKNLNSTLHESRLFGDAGALHFNEALYSNTDIEYDHLLSMNVVETVALVLRKFKRKKIYQIITAILMMGDVPPSFVMASLGIDEHELDTKELKAVGEILQMVVDF